MSEAVIYLDHAAATPLDERVLEVMVPYYSEQFYNPSSPYLPAVRVRRDYEAAKSQIAQIIGGKADEIIITAGATESINLAFNSVSGNVIVSNIEHHAVLEAAKRRQVTFAPVNNKGILQPETVSSLITPETELISVALANNELGTVQPIRDIAEVIKTERMRRLDLGEKTQLLLHVDASQGVGQLDIHVARLGVDLLTINAGKIYGPKQVGLLWVRSGIAIQPQIVGGGQERALRSGTENVAGVVGFAKALELADAHKHGESKRLAKLRDELQEKLVEAFPDAVVSGSLKKRLSGHLHISFPGIDGERLVFALESRGVLVATGSACAANKGTRSHVLEAIGLAPEVADGSLRLTLGRLSNETNIARGAEIIVEEITKELQRVSS